MRLRSCLRTAACVLVFARYAMKDLLYVIYSLNTNMITFTSQAATKVKQQLSRRTRGFGIKIGVRTTGCSGLSYVLEFVDVVDSTDNEFNSEGLRIFIDPKSLIYLDNMVVDYVRKGLNEGFEFSNPNERDRCGCGESFRV